MLLILSVPGNNHDLLCCDGVPTENKVETRWNKNMFELAEDRAEWRAVRFGFTLLYY